MNDLHIILRKDPQVKYLRQIEVIAQNKEFVD